MTQLPDAPHWAHATAFSKKKTQIFCYFFHGFTVTMWASRELQVNSRCLLAISQHEIHKFLKCLSSGGFLLYLLLLKICFPFSFNSFLFFCEYFV